MSKILLSFAASPRLFAAPRIGTVVVVLDGRRIGWVWTERRWCGDCGRHHRRHPRHRFDEGFGGRRRNIRSALTGNVPAPLNDPPGVKYILFDMTIAPGEEFTGGFASLVSRSLVRHNQGLVSSLACKPSLPTLSTSAAKRRGLTTIFALIWPRAPIRSHSFPVRSTISLVRIPALRSTSSRRTFNCS